MFRVFFDCEFTKLPSFLDPEPNELVSIGCISENGKTFYAENSCYKTTNCSEFVIETVIPLLQGGKFLKHYKDISIELKAWLESFDAEICLWSDSPDLDWQHIKHMFDTWGWPCNLNQKPNVVDFDKNRRIRFDNAVDEAFRSHKPKLRRHHALDDAVANKHGFKVANVSYF